MQHKIGQFGPYILLAIFFACSIIFRPLLPIDETRYLTVAWEMFLQKQYTVLSLNFAPYHHKPPFLFWSINAVWELLGVSRAAAMIPIFLASSLFIFLTTKLTKDLLPDYQGLQRIMPWAVLCSIPFLIYSSLIMFDIMLSCAILAYLLTLRSYVREDDICKVIKCGIILGLGVLIKGPVILVYLLGPILGYKYWKPENSISSKKFSFAVLGSIIIGAALVFIWLIPALTQTSDEFSYSLIWHQSAGRVTGNMEAAHSRPFYFYLMFLPLLFMPWVFFPKFWQGVKNFSNHPAFKFLIVSSIPAFILFSIISGKQPHYMVPLLPFILIFSVYWLKDIDIKVFKLLGSICVVLLCIGQFIGSKIYFDQIDLKPLAEFYNANQDNQNWSFVRKYQGEIGFLTKAKTQIESLERDDLPKWFEKYPNGLAIIRYSDKDDNSHLNLLFTMPYKGKNIGVFELKD